MFFSDCSLFDQYKSRLVKVFHRVFLPVFPTALHIIQDNNNARIAPSIQLFVCSRNYCVVLN